MTTPTLEDFEEAQRVLAKIQDGGLRVHVDILAAELARIRGAEAAKWNGVEQALEITMSKEDELRARLKSAEKDMAELRDELLRLQHRYDTELETAKLSEESLIRLVATVRRVNAGQAEALVPRDATLKVAREALIGIDHYARHTDDCKCNVDVCDCGLVATLKAKCLVVEAIDRVLLTAVAPKAPVDNCRFCLGAKGGIKGNENRFGDIVVCDFCTALLIRTHERSREIAERAAESYRDALSAANTAYAELTARLAALDGIEKG